MATVTARGAARPSLLGKLSSAAARAKKRGPGKLAAFAATAREHVVTAAALGAVDLGVFHYGAGPGWIMTGISLLTLDFAVRG